MDSVDHLHCGGVASHLKLVAAATTTIAQLVVLGVISQPWVPVLNLAAGKHFEQPIAVTETE